MAIFFSKWTKRIKVGWVIRFISKGLLLDVKLNRKYFPILNWEWMKSLNGLFKIFFWALKEYLDCLKKNNNVHIKIRASNRTFLTGHSQNSLKLWNFDLPAVEVKCNSCNECNWNFGLKFVSEQISGFWLFSATKVYFLRLFFSLFSPPPPWDIWILY